MKICSSPHISHAALMICSVLLVAHHGLAQFKNGQPVPAAQKSKNEALTSEAWKAFNEDQFELAVTKADECIAEFHREAEKRQKELAESNEPAPPEGHVDDESLKNKILGWGLLNDVAACYYIKGEACRKLMQRAEDNQRKKAYQTEAKKAYEACAKLTFARVYDITPPTWFWIPANKSNERLEDFFASGTK